MEPTPQRWWDLPSALLLTAMLLVAAARLAVTDWTPDLPAVELVAFVGGILGLVLGGSRFRTRGLALLTTGYSLTVLPWILSGTLAEEAGFRERLISLFGRWGNDLFLLTYGKRIEDPLFFVTLMAAIFWGIALYAGYQLVRRGNVLAAGAPAGLGMLIIQIYDFRGSSRLWSLALYFFLCLLLLGRMTYLHNRAEWRRRKISAAPEADFDINAGILASAVVIILAAWLAPLSWEAFTPVERSWRELDQSFNSARRKLDDVLAAVHGTPRGIGEAYGSSLALGRQAITGNGALFDVRPSATDVVRYYWRARVYDTYESDRWSSTQTAQQDFSPKEPDLAIQHLETGASSEFTVRMLSDSATLVTAGQALWVSRTAELTLQRGVDGSSEVVGIRAQPPLLAGDSYSVRSVIPDPTVAELRTAGSDYPDWIRERYLQLPEGFSPRVTALAASLTGGSPTPYDKARSITEYLRSNIQYSQTVPALQPGQDPLEAFLFTWRSGFCNYYATSEVLMLRSAGIPARLVVGYAQGNRDESPRAQRVVFLVHQSDSHAWPEVYFPGAGWVEFEPTTSQPDIFRAEDPSPGDGSQGASPTREGIARSSDDQVAPGSGLQDAGGAFANVNKPAVWVIIILVVGVGGFALWQTDRRSPLVPRVQRALKGYYEKRNQPVPPWITAWINRRRLTPIGRAFGAINWSLSRLGSRQPVDATPAERAARLSQLLPEAAEPVGILAAEFEAESFSPRPGDLGRARRAGNRIRLLAIKRILTRYF